MWTLNQSRSLAFVILSMKKGKYLVRLAQDSVIVRDNLSQTYKKWIERAA